MESPTISQMLDHRVRDEIHSCVVPRCAERARFASYITAGTRLAGRDWIEGDFVDFCGDHLTELWKAVADAVALGYDRDEDTRIALGLMFGPSERNPLDRLREWDGS